MITAQHHVGDNAGKMAWHDDYDDDDDDDDNDNDDDNNNNNNNNNNIWRSTVRDSNNTDFCKSIIFSLIAKKSTC